MYLRAHPAYWRRLRAGRSGRYRLAPNNGGGYTTDDCGAHAVANPGDAQLNSSQSTAKPTNEGAELL